MHSSVHAHWLCQLTASTRKDRSKETTSVTRWLGRTTWCWCISATWLSCTTPARLWRSVDSLQNSACVEVHDDAWIQELINNQDDTTHVFDKRLAFDTLPEDSIKAIMHAVEELAKDQFIVLTMTNDENCHIRVASEDSHIVIDSHDVVLEWVDASALAASATLLAWLKE